MTRCCFEPPDRLFALTLWIQLRWNNPSYPSVLPPFCFALPRCMRGTLPLCVWGLDVVVSVGDAFRIGRFSAPQPPPKLGWLAVKNSQRRFLKGTLREQTLENRLRQQPGAPHPRGGPQPPGFPTEAVPAQCALRGRRPDRNVPLPGLGSSLLTMPSLPSIFAAGPSITGRHPGN